MTARNPATDVNPALVDDPDGPLLGGSAQLPILSRHPERLPLMDRRGPLPEWAVRIAVLLLACSLFLPNVGSFGLWDPWETHYGEVTRYMIETGDWIHPWWGYKGEKIGGEAGPGEHFYSKPILLFWMEATSIRALGLSELSIRLPVAFIAILAMFVVFYAFSKMLGGPRGFLIAVVLGTCPQFFFIARQAQTDMPFVGTLTIALSFFCLALFAPRQRTSDRRMWAILSATIAIVLTCFLPQLGIVAADVAHEIPPGPDGTAPSFFTVWKHTGVLQAATFALLMLPVVLSMIVPAVRNYSAGGGAFDEAFKDQLRRKCYLWLFYTFCGLSLMAKGLLGFALPGAIIFVYLVVTNEWTLLAQPHKGGVRGRAEIIRGLVIFLCVGLPWYVALLSGPEGKDFWNRFFIHDHFNRLGTGVHSIDDGTFEHFLKWLGYGMWPWVAFFPLALLALLRYKLRDRSATNRLRLFLFLWFFLAYSLFTLSSTKFHHYIFPALPPLAILTAWSLYDHLHDRTWVARTMVAFAIGLAGLIGWDIYNDPQHLRNQFTYKYDRILPPEEERPIDADQKIVFHPTDTSDWEPDKTWAEGDFYKHTPPLLHEILNVRLFRFETWIPFIGGVIGLALLLMIWARARPIGLALFTTAAVAMAMWGLNYYMPMLSTHWSQKYLFERYYDTCVPARNPRQIDEAFTPQIAGSELLTEFFAPKPKRMCREEVISWLLTWRGETYYSNNAIRPIQKENTQFDPYLTDMNRGARYYVHIERTRAKGFVDRANSHLRKLSGNPHFKGVEEYRVTLEHNENHWFVLLKADPVCKDGYRKDVVGRCIALTASR